MRKPTPWKKSRPPAMRALCMPSPHATICARLHQRSRLVNARPTRVIRHAVQQLPASCDVAIIGSGVGGLTAGALLSKAGLSVCVLERENRPGGYLAGF